MNFEDFKKEAAEWIKGIYDMFHGFEDSIAENIKWFADQRDKLLEAIKGKFKSESDALNEAFDEIDERFKKIEHFLFVTSCIVMQNKDGEFPDYETRKGLCEYLGYDWDKTVQDFRESQGTQINPS